MAIEVVNRQRLARIDENRIARLVNATLAAVGKTGASLTVAFVRDRIMQDLNRRFGATDRTTDVLSFPSANARGGAGDDDCIGADVAEYLGDIAISTDTALRQAHEAGHSFEREVDELVMHGVIHLCGYDHETDGGEMTMMELKLRRKLLDQD